MNFQLNDVLSEAIEGMDIPENRKDTKFFGNLMWMIRNLGIRNSEHPNYKDAISIIKHILRDKNYIEN